jgi:hypothetical protein
MQTTIGTTTNHAERFLAICNTLKLLQMEYILSGQDKDVYKMMREASTEKTVWNVGGWNAAGATRCCLSLLKDDSDGSNPRKGLPHAIINDILEMHRKFPQTYVGWEPVQRAKIPHSWFACFVHNVLPDVQDANWKTFQCSHRCTKSACVNPAHLCWESASTNQSR